MRKIPKFPSYKIAELVAFSKLNLNNTNLRRSVDLISRHRTFLSAYSYLGDYSVLFLVSYCDIRDTGLTLDFDNSNFHSHLFSSLILSHPNSTDNFQSDFFLLLDLYFDDTLLSKEQSDIYLSWIFASERYDRVYLDYSLFSENNVPTQLSVYKPRIPADRLNNSSFGKIWKVRDFIYFRSLISRFEYMFHAYEFVPRFFPTIFRDFLNPLLSFIIKSSLILSSILIFLLVPSYFRKNSLNLVDSFYDRIETIFRFSRIKRYRYPRKIYRIHWTRWHLYDFRYYKYYITKKLSTKSIIYFLRYLYCAFKLHGLFAFDMILLRFGVDGRLIIHIDTKSDFFRAFF